MLNGVFQRHARIVIVIGWAVAVGYHIVRCVMKKTGTEDGLEVLDGDETLERAILRSVAPPTNPLRCTRTESGWARSR